MPENRSEVKMSYERMLDKEHPPSEEEILNTIGQTAA
jgi:hypothetical protein